mgnify:CR=1 FL=1
MSQFPACSAPISRRTAPAGALSKSSEQDVILSYLPEKNHYINILLHSVFCCSFDSTPESGEIRKLARELLKIDRDAFAQAQGGTPLLTPGKSGPDFPGVIIKNHRGAPP